MSEWRPMETAPRDGTCIQVRVPGQGSDYVVRWYGGFVTDFNDCEGAAWIIADEQEPPDGWCDGVCWAVNSDLEPSTPPDAWKPLPDEEGGR